MWKIHQPKAIAKKPHVRKILKVNMSNLYHTSILAFKFYLNRTKIEI